VSIRVHPWFHSLRVRGVICVADGLSGPALLGWAYRETGSVYVGVGIAVAALLVGTALAMFAIPHARLPRPG